MTTSQSNVFTFEGNIAFSRGAREATDIETIKVMIDGCVQVIKTGEEKDRLHVDYEATLRGGAVVEIDAKARRQGCSAYWKDGPDVALETWSVIPSLWNDGKVGWTLDESSRTGLYLFTYHPTDTDQCFLFPSQHLRIAFRRNYKKWLMRWNRGKEAEQTTADKTTGEIRWKSSCIFVPATEVLTAMRDVSIGQVKWVDG